MGLFPYWWYFHRCNGPGWNRLFLELRKAQNDQFVWPRKPSVFHDLFQDYSDHRKRNCTLACNLGILSFYSGACKIYKANKQCSAYISIQLIYFVFLLWKQRENSVGFKIFKIFLEVRTLLMCLIYRFHCMIQISNHVLHVSFWVCLLLEMICFSEELIHKI